MLALILALAMAEPPAAMQPAFRGTIVSTYPDGRTAKLWLSQDGTYQAVGRRRKPSSGVWTVKDAQVCLKQRKPFGAPFGYCSPLPSASEWSAKAVTGEPIRVRLEPGGRP